MRLDYKVYNGFALRFVSAMASKERGCLWSDKLPLFLYGARIFRQLDGYIKVYEKIASRLSCWRNAERESLNSTGRKLKN